MKLVRLNLVTHDDRAGDLLARLQEQMAYFDEDPNIPYFVFLGGEIRSVPSKLMAKMTTDEKEMVG